MNRRRFFGCFAAMAAAPALLPDCAGLSRIKPDLDILNTFDVGTGNRADMLDIISNISPMDTLYRSGFNKVPATMNHEWLVDILARRVA